jgi:hypothetical protein
VPSVRKITCKKRKKRQIQSKKHHIYIASSPFSISSLKNQPNYLLCKGLIKDAGIKKAYSILDQKKWFNSMA